MFTTVTQATKRHLGPNTRSDFDHGIGDYLGPFPTIAEAVAAGVKWMRETAAHGYEIGWIMVDEDETNRTVVDIPSGDVELHITRAWPLNYREIPAPQPPNPVVKQTALRAYPGWTVREYADGMYDATGADGSLTRGVDSFRGAVAEVREMLAR